MVHILILLKIFLLESIYLLINFCFILLSTFFLFSFFLVILVYIENEAVIWYSRTPLPGFPEHQLKYQSEETLKRPALICAAEN